MRIPWRELSEEALQGVAEAFVLREGTDYGHRDYPLVAKVRQVLARIRNGEVVITYDPETDTIDLQSAEEPQAAEPRPDAEQPDAPPD